MQFQVFFKDLLSERFAIDSSASKRGIAIDFG
jgi:hypothetical protein